MARSATAKSNPTVSALNHKFSITVLTCVKHKKYVIDHADHSNACLNVICFLFFSFDGLSVDQLGNGNMVLEMFL